MHGCLVFNGQSIGLAGTLGEEEQVGPIGLAGSLGEEEQVGPIGLAGSLRCTYND